MAFNTGGAASGAASGALSGLAFAPALGPLAPLAPIIGGLLGGAGGGFLGGGDEDGGADILDALFQIAQNPSSIPLLGTLSGDISDLGLGVESIGARQAASPLNQVIQAIDEDGTISLENKIRMKAQAREIIRTGDIPATGPLRKMFRRGLARSPFNTAREFLRAQKDFDKQQKDLDKELGPIRDTVLAGRTANAEAIANLLSGESFNTDELQGVIEQRLSEELDDREQRALRAGNLGGFNPANLLGDIEQQRSLIPATALQEAISLISGKGTELGFRLAAAGQPQAAATSLLGVQVPSLVNAASVGGNQLVSLQNQLLAANAGQGQSGGFLDALSPFATLGFLKQLGGPAADNKSGGGGGVEGLSSDAFLSILPSLSSGTFAGL